MATTIKCEDCKAGSVRSRGKGYPACPHCGGRTARTTHQYKAPFFSLDGTKPSGWVGLTVPTAGDVRDPNVSIERLRPRYYAHILADQELQLTEYALSLRVERGCDEAILARFRAECDARRAQAVVARDTWLAERTAIEAKHGPLLVRIPNGPTAA